ncbi:MAG: fold metallo-hydrolase [Deltaproteobacteria bacterium]|nr:fold metallo-hydrolase [Deltaproteobacteria bacterium]
MARRILMGFGVLLLLVFGVVGVRFWRFLQTETVKIDDRFYVVTGGGGNTAVLIGDDGVLVVDPKFWSPGRRLPTIIRSLTAKPVTTIINTHYHADHTHGNANYPAGAEVIAHRRTRAHLLARDGGFWEVEPAWSSLPNAQLDDERQLQFGDESIRVIHPGRGHTDGDVVVYFSRRRVLHTGDLFVHGIYPVVDRRAGGTAREWVESLDRVLGLGDTERYIPGHGSLATRADVERFRDYLRDLVSQVERAVSHGASLAEVQRAVDLGAFADFQGLPFLNSQAQNVRWVYEELTHLRAHDGETGKD